MNINVTKHLQNLFTDIFALINKTRCSQEDPQRHQDLLIFTDKDNWFSVP